MPEESVRHLSLPCWDYSRHTRISPVKFADAPSSLPLRYRSVISAFYAQHTAWLSRPCCLMLNLRAWSWHAPQGEMTEITFTCYQVSWST